MTSTNSQCKTCNMTEEITEYLTELHKQGVGFKALSGMLERDHGIHIADTSIGNHFKKHTNYTKIRAKDSVNIKTTDTNLRVKYPKGYTPSVELNEDGTGMVVSMPQDTEVLLTDYSDILREMGIDPNSFKVVGSAGISKWQSSPDTWSTSYRVRIEKIVDEEPDVEDPDFEPLPLLVSRAKEFGNYTPQLYFTNRVKDDETTVCVSLGDMQTGKVGSRGGTVDLINRVRVAQDKLAQYVEASGATSSVLLDAGDIIEGFENVKAQEFTNDLSLMEQVDLAHTLELEFVDLLRSATDHVDVMSIPSNHAAWRKGKDYLGRPGDDWGIHIARRIEKELDKYVPGHNVDFHYSDMWKKSLNLNVQGYGLGLVHGDDAKRPEAMDQWWMKQVHGGGPTALSDILVHGHYHTFRAYSSGRSLSGAQKWILGSPTLDNGSDWFANGPGGSDSDPGLLVFQIRKGHGLDLQSLTVL